MENKKVMAATFPVHLRTDGDQQKIDSCLHGSPHTDNTEPVVQLDQEIADSRVNQETDKMLRPCGEQQRAGRLPKHGTAFFARCHGEFGQ